MTARVTSAPTHNAAPWSDGLPERVRRHLKLDAVEALATHEADVVVIGAGVAGLNGALAARVAGAEVLVLEAASAIGQGATGRNAGILSAGVNMPLADVPDESPLRAMWPETTRLLLNIVAETSQPDALIVASRTGSLSLAERSSAARHLTKEAKARNDAGLNAEMWTPEQVAEATGGRLNTQTLQGALWLPDEGRLHPLTLLAHLARAARAAGVRLIGNARVESREEVKGRGGAHSWRLTLAGGTTISARGLVLATGPTATPTARIYALAFPANLPDDFPLFWDSAPYTYCDFRPGNGRLGVSGGRYGRVGLAKRDAHYHQQLADAARHWLPELADVPPSHAWAVDLAVTADMVPNLVEVGEQAPGQSIEGLGALGVLPGSVLGRQAGEMVAKRVG